MKRFLLAFCLVACLESPSAASSVSFANSISNGPRVVTSAGVPVGNGMLVRVGYLAITGDPTSFVEFGSATTSSIAGFDSYVVANPVNNNNGEADDAPFNGRDVYLWIYNSNVISFTVDQGLFRASDAAALAFPVATWDFPNDGGVLDTITLLMDAVDQAINAPGHGGAAVILDGVPGVSGNTNALRLGAIPEPSGHVLFFTASFLLYRRRR